MTTELALIFPLLPGKREALTEFAEALLGPRRAEYEASQVTVVKESWFLQPTPIGDMVVVHFEAPDPAMVLAGLAASEEAFDVWFREQIQQLSGLDLTQPSSQMPERVFHWARN